MRTSAWQSRRQLVASCLWRKMQEEVSYAGVIGSANGFTLHNDIVLPYFIGLCNDEQKARWLPGMVSGERIGAIAMTEPNTGSDLANIRTTAVRHGDTYVVNGSKTFITNGINSDAVIVAVKTDSEAKHRGISLIVLERGMNGFERGRNLDKLGMHAQDTAELFFTDVEVPVANLLGEEGKGFYSLMLNLAQERLGMAVGALAVCQAALDQTLACTRVATPYSSCSTPPSSCSYIRGGYCFSALCMRVKKSSSMRFSRKRPSPPPPLLA